MTSPTRPIRPAPSRGRAWARALGFGRRRLRKTNDTWFCCNRMAGPLFPPRAQLLLLLITAMYQQLQQQQQQSSGTLQFMRAVETVLVTILSVDVGRVGQ